MIRGKDTKKKLERELKRKKKGEDPNPLMRCDSY
jgi:hypothetical protein